jgi:hypothetical protein
MDGQEQPAEDPLTALSVNRRRKAGSVNSSGGYPSYLGWGGRRPLVLPVSYAIHGRLLAGP